MNDETFLQRAVGEDSQSIDAGAVPTGQTSNEKDSKAVHDLFYEFHYPDDLGVIKSKIIEYVTTARREAIEETWKAAGRVGGYKAAMLALESAKKERENDG